MYKNNKRYNYRNLATSWKYNYQGSNCATCKYCNQDYTNKLNNNMVSSEAYGCQSCDNCRVRQRYTNENSNITIGTTSPSNPLIPPFPGY